MFPGIKSIMKFSILFLAVFILPFLTSSQTPGLKEIRTEFSKATKEEPACTKLYERMCVSSGNEDAVWIAYHGTLTMSMAKYTINPFRKYEYFKNGKLLIEKSIAMDPENIEVRFLRFTIQDHVPAFLGYDNQLSEDKKFLLQNLEKTNPAEIKRAIINYIIDCDRFSPIEKKWASNLIHS